MSSQRKNKNIKRKVLVLSPSPELFGGVANYYNAVFNHYKSDSFNLEHFLVGKRPGKSSNIYYLIVLFCDIVRMFFKLFNKDYVLVHLNPSLGTSPVLRDALFLLVARMHSKKILVFWRGWEDEFEKRIDNKIMLSLLFRVAFKKADTFIVLASSFREKLRHWGFSQEIILETTTVDDSLLNGFSIDRKIKKLKGSGKLQILFLSRIELRKGIMETIDAFSAINFEERDLSLVIAGGGPDYDMVKEKIKALGNRRISLLGYVRGEKKREILEESHIMCFPTSYGEGLPNAILEAMAFGMPIITRPVGGIPDNFVEGENGYYVQSLDKESFSKLLKSVISDKESLAKMAINNYRFARERFLASIVAKRLDSIYNKIVKK
ncbi:MAG: glycosyltransferase family 4 protein [Maribacter sp.]|nr:glycosyltransferase family 4 protein [Maribacter sp.]